MSAREIAAQLGKARREGRGWRTECPRHHGYSLNIADGRDGKLIVKCWAGCTFEEIFESLRQFNLHDEWSPQRDHDANRRDASATQHTLWARRGWERVKDARQTPVKAYIRSRGITLPVPSTLCWVPS